MPQLDLSAFFLQFLTISSLLFWLTWLLINNILEIVYMIIICRNTIITYFNNFKLNIFTFFQVELKNILINFYKLIKFNIFKLINFLPKILTIYNYFSRLQVFISAVQLKLNDNLIINHSLLNLKQLNV